MKELNDFLENEFKMLDRGIVATPSCRANLEAFAKANGGSMDILLVQMAINFGYKMALENITDKVLEVTFNNINLTNK